VGVIHLIRHGQVLLGAPTGDTLSDRGRDQSSAVGQAWEAAGFMPSDAVVGSAPWHAQTAVAAIDACGGPDGYDVDAGWNDQDEAVESYARFVDRVAGSFEQAVKLANSARAVAVFTSGGPVAAVVSRLLAGDDSLFRRLGDVMINASVTTVVVDAAGPRLLSFNEHAHLPRDLITYQ